MTEDWTEISTEGHGGISTEGWTDISTEGWGGYIDAGSAFIGDGGTTF